jgi:hypothetical protein
MTIPWRLAKRALCLAFLAAGCVSLTPGGERVRILDYDHTRNFRLERDRVVAGCKLLKTEKSKEGPDEVRKLRNYAADIGVDTLLNEGPDFQTYMVDFYQCGTTQPASGR